MFVCNSITETMREWVKRWREELAKGKCGKWVGLNSGKNTTSGIMKNFPFHLLKWKYIFSDYKSTPSKKTPLLLPIITTQFPTGLLHYFCRQQILNLVLFLCAVMEVWFRYIIFINEYCAAYVDTFYTNIQNKGCTKLVSNKIPKHSIHLYAFVEHNDVQQQFIGFRAEKRKIP